MSGPASGRQVVHLRIGRIRPFAVLATVVLAGVLVVGAQDTPDRLSARSVVHVFATTAKGQSLGTGFAWLDDTHIVTALHVVAGANPIEVRSEVTGRGAAATVERVNLEADLALLRITPSLGLKPLTVAPPQLAEEHMIWGYPLEVFRMQGDDIRFSRTLEATPTMLSIFQTEAKFRQAVGNQGYPSARSQILRVSSIITHGFSGAPILNKAGQVVGIGDGGLNQGIARVNWAIPAAVYLRLESFKDPAPREAAAASSLMSATREKPVEIANQPADSTLKWSWSAELGDIIDSLPEMDAEDLDQEDLLDALDGLPDSVMKTRIDVYEDSETGATVALPAGVQFSYDSARRLLRAEDGQVAMLLQIIQGNALAARSQFEALVKEDATWQAFPDDPDENYRIGDFWYSSQRRRAVDPRDRSKVEADVDITLVVSGADFLGSAIALSYDQGVADQDLDTFQLLTACLKLSDFGTR